MLNMERIPDQMGYLVMAEDGAVIASGGDLENDEKVANIISNLVMLTKSVDPETFPAKDGFKKLSLIYDDHCFIICLSNKKIHVVKKVLKPKAQASTPDVAVNA